MSGVGALATCLPLVHTHPRTMTHDHRRHGTTTLFAALDYLDGKLISATKQWHTHIGGAFPEADRARDTKKLRIALDRRQLRDPQAFESEGVARQAPALQYALHPNIVIMAQSGRAVLRRSDGGYYPIRQLRLG